MDMLRMMLQIFVFNKKIMNFNYAKETTIMKKAWSTYSAHVPVSLAPSLCMRLYVCLRECVCVCVCIRH